MGVLSPLARSRLTPMFDVRTVVLKANQALDTYLGDRARGIHECWEPEPLLDKEGSRITTHESRRSRQAVIGV